MPPPEGGTGPSEQTGGDNSALPKPTRSDNTKAYSPSVGGALQSDFSSSIKDLLQNFEDYLVSSGYDRKDTLRNRVDSIAAKYKLLYSSDNIDVLENFYKINLEKASKDNPSIAKIDRLDIQKLEIPHWLLLSIYAFDEGFTITGTNETKGHNRGSAHYTGDAIDMRIWNVSRAKINKFIVNASLHGITVLDERIRPPNQKVWKGPHLHFETPTVKRPFRVRLSPAFGIQPSQSGTKIKINTLPNPKFKLTIP